MIVVAESYLRFSRKFERETMNDASVRLLIRAEAIAGEFYQRFPVRVYVRVEQGSTRTWVTISAVSGVLIFYGEVRQSVDYQIRDARRVADVLVPAVREEFRWPESSLRYKQRRTGIPGRLRKLFESVERRGLTPEEATSRAIDLLYLAEGPSFVDVNPQLAEKLAVEMRQAAAQPRLVRRQRRRSPEPREPAPPKPTPLLPSPPIGVIVTRDAVTGRPKVTSY